MCMFNKNCWKYILNWVFMLFSSAYRQTYSKRKSPHLGSAVISEYLDYFPSVTWIEPYIYIYIFCTLIQFVSFSHLFISFPPSFSFLLRSFGLHRKFSFHFSGPDNSRTERIFRRTIWWSKEALHSGEKRDILKWRSLSILSLCYSPPFL